MITYNPLTPMEMEFIEMFNDNYDLMRFMLCSPHSTDPVLNYGGRLSKVPKKDAFLKELYVPGSTQVEDEILMDILSGGKSTIKLIGNKGCGKTMLVHNLRKTLNANDKLRTIMFDFGESRSTLKFGQAKEKVATKIYEKLKKDCTGYYCTSLKWLSDLYQKICDLIDIRWDANNQLDELFQAISEVLNSNCANKSKLLKTKVRPILYKLELFQIIFVFILLDLSSNPNNTRTTVFLDNLDNMVDIKDIKLSLMHYNNFLSGVSELFATINEALDTDFVYNYVFVFVLRDTTNTYLSHHELAIKQIAFQEYDVSHHYSKREIGIRRINLFSKFVRSSSISSSTKKELLDKSELLASILKDHYVTDTIFDIFNNDYRICLMTMIKIVSSNTFGIDEYTSIYKSGFSHGSRGVIYRLLFNIFNKSGYFKRIKILDFNNRGIKSSSPSRLILTYIANSTDSRLTHDSRVVSFEDLLDDIDGKIPAQDVIRCLWEMYNLVTAEDWCNLISFAESDDASETGLHKELRYYDALKNNRSEENQLNFTTFRITSSGLVFLTYVCVHFEYFACRLFDAKYPPLFLPNALEKTNDQYNFKITIDAVLSEVKTCAQKLRNTYEAEGNLCSHSDSLFVFRRPGKSSQYHVERLIFSHIQYLDEFRRFVLKTKTGVIRNEVSDYILGKLQEYLNIFEEEQIKCSQYGEQIVLKQLKKLLDEAKLDPYNPNRVVGRD